MTKREWRSIRCSVFFSEAETKMIKQANLLPPVVMEEITDPVELKQALKRRELFDRNWRWFSARAPEIYANHRGQVVCISGQELFVGDTPEVAVSLAKAAHPDDEGRFTLCIPQERMLRIYAHRR
jgi:hypothetical protein